MRGGVKSCSGLELLLVYYILSCIHQLEPRDTMNFMLYFTPF